jgi:TonB family protein
MTTLSPTPDAPHEAAPSPEVTDAWTSLAASSDTLPEGPVARASVRDDVVGRWMIAVDDRIRAVWTYPEAQRVQGVTGNVTVSFRVRRNGKVVSVQIVDGSGDPYLDVAAFSAIPAELPPLPRGAPRTIDIRYTFRYR